MGLLSILGLGTSKANEYNIPVENFGVVVPGKIYRSAAPDLVSIEAAREKIKFKAILDLRDGWNKEAWRAYAALLWARYGITAYNVPFDDKSYPDARSVSIALHIIENEEGEGIWIHCEGGRHRTGGIIAEYRKRIMGWTPAEAYAEAKKYDFYSRFGHRPWKDFILSEVA